MDRLRESGELDLIVRTLIRSDREPAVISILQELMANWETIPGPSRLEYLWAARTLCPSSRRFEDSGYCRLCTTDTYSSSDPLCGRCAYEVLGLPLP